MDFNLKMILGIYCQASNLKVSDVTAPIRFIYFGVKDNIFTFIKYFFGTIINS